MRSSDEDEGHWVDTGFGSRTIPTAQYVIDPGRARILTREEWSRYYSYATVTEVSADGRLELRTTRSPRGDDDYLFEVLRSRETGQVLSKSSSIAFRETAPASLMTRFVQEQERSAAERARIAALPSLDEVFARERDRLQPGDVLLKFGARPENVDDYITRGASRLYVLRFDDPGFGLYASAPGAKIGDDPRDYRRVRSYRVLEEFTAGYLATKADLLRWQPFGFRGGADKANRLLLRHVVHVLNELRRRHDFTALEYDQLRSWESVFYVANTVHPNEYRQYCPNCGSSVTYYPRYPKFICRACVALLVDEDGYGVSFGNVGIGGGVRGYRKVDGETVPFDPPGQLGRCYIGGRAFDAEEARFGGVVVQAVDVP